MCGHAAVRAGVLRCAVLLTAVGYCSPTGALAAPSTPAAPDELTGSIAYHAEEHIPLSGPEPGETGHRDESITINLQNIVMKLDHKQFGQAFYVVQSAQATITGGITETDMIPHPGDPRCPVETVDIEAPSFAPGHDGDRVGKLQIALLDSSAGATCRPSALLMWSEPITYHQTETYSGRDDCKGKFEHDYSGPLFLPQFGNVGLSKGRESVAGGLVRLEFYLDQTQPSGLRETLQASFYSTGAQDLKAVDLEIADLYRPELDKQKDGGLVVKHITAEEDPEDGDNTAPRQKITLCGMGGKVVLENPGPKVKIYTQPTGGDPLAFNGMDNQFDNASLPKDLYVEGAAGSDSMRDVRITAELGGAPDSNDWVAFTVLDVEKPTLRWGADEVISSDNNKRKAWINNPGEATDKLGPQAVTYQATVTAPGGGKNTVTKVDMGWALEGRAEVHPSDFQYPNLPPGVPANLPVVLDRDAELHAWWGNGSLPGIPNYRPDLFSDKVPPGNDGWWKGDAFSDVSPRPDGAIYNLDKPGPDYTGAQLYGLADRIRYSFKIFADVQIEPGKWVRCSPITKYSVLQSWVQLAKPSGFTWQLLTNANAPPGITVIAGDNNVYLGDAWFDRWSWDLQ